MALARNQSLDPKGTIMILLGNIACQNHPEYSQTKLAGMATEFPIKGQPFTFYCGAHNHGDTTVRKLVTKPLVSVEKSSIIGEMSEGVDLYRLQDDWGRIWMVQLMDLRCKYFREMRNPEIRKQTFYMAEVLVEAIGKLEGNDNHVHG